MFRRLQRASIVTMLRRHRASAVVGTVAAVGALVAGLVAAGIDGYPVQRPRLLSGAAWLASSAVGQLTLLDGSSVEVAAQVKAASPRDGLDVVQRDAHAYAVNRKTGSILRVDGATYELTPPVAPLPDAGDGRLTVFASADSVYALDTHRGVLAVVDPRTLQTRGTPVTVSTRTAPHASTLDDDGRLWMLDGESGALIWLDGGQRRVRYSAVRPGAGSLALAAGRPVLLDGQRGMAATLDPADGSVETTTALDLRRTDRPLAVGAAHGDRLYVVASRGALALCDLRSTGCPTAVSVGAPAPELGAPVEVAGRVFVPDYATGQVWIVDAGSSTVVARPQVLGPGVEFQLLARDGIVFFNDPNSEKAGVIRLDGGVQQVKKYDPNDPAKGLTPPPNPTAGSTSTPSPSAPPSPDPSPTAQSPTGPAPIGPAPTGPAPIGPAPIGPAPIGPAPIGPAPVVPPGAPTAHTVRITMSKNQAGIGETVTFRVDAVQGPAPTDAHWEFGDGQHADSLTTSHVWTLPRTYQVSVRATFADGQTTTASVAVVVRAAAPTLPVPRYTLTVQVQGAGTVTGGGISCPPACIVTAVRGTAVTLTARAAVGAHLNSWGGACSGTATTCTVILDGGRSVSAQFSVNLAAPKDLRPALVCDAFGAERDDGTVHM